MAIIGDIWDQNTQELFGKTRQLGYRIINLPVKQVCYRDYYKHNKFFPEDCCRSSLTLLLHQNVPFDAQNVIEACGEDKFCKQLEKYTDKMIVQDLVTIGVLPKWGLNLIEDSDQYQRFLEMGTKVLSQQYEIPDYIDNYDDFEFWYLLRSRDKYPKLIDCLEKFKEFKAVYNELESPNGFQNLKDRGVIPPWVPNTQIATQVIWLEFSTTNKGWKESAQHFRRKFGSTYNRDTGFFGSLFV